MKSKKECVYRSVNVILFVFALISFITLRDSIQKTRQQEKLEGYQTFVSEVILPSKPRYIQIAKAEVKPKPKATTVAVKVVVPQDTSATPVLATYTGSISHYGIDCRGCSGVTASGYNVRNGNIYYQDKTYGTVRVVAGDSKFSFGTIIRTTVGGQSILAIVLDRGGGIGFGKTYLFDLLCESEAKSYQLGVEKGATIEVLRYGF